MTAIILINWNGADDTIACLKSLDKAHGDFLVVVADNGSTDDSLKRIGDCVQELSIKVDLLPLDRNWGFAVGNNKGIAHAMRYNPDSYMLLNNDTEVEPDFLSRIEDCRRKHPEIKVFGPLILYWSDRGCIWSCGGKLTFGSRKAYYRNRPVSDVRLGEIFPVSFISGCALFADSSLVQDNGQLLTERFFFGEEDYEFAHRMRIAARRMAVVPDSVIYHKVSASSRNATEKFRLGRDYIYYLGRLIVVREYYSRLSSLLVRILSFPLCVHYFRLDGLDFRKAFRLSCRLMSDAKRKHGISYDDFKAITIDGSYFNN